MPMTTEMPDPTVWLHKVPGTVWLRKVPGYDDPGLPAAVRSLLAAMAGALSLRGAKVLVKPNLLAPTPPHFLPCTHPAVVRETCLYLLEQGAVVGVGDSPSLGKGTEIAGKIGLTKALADLPVRLVELETPRPTRFPFGARVALAAEALDNDFVFNLPKLKTHHQVGVTAAVKNVFGCIVGMNKTLCHARFGEWGDCFETLLLQLEDVLPPIYSLVDGISAMQGAGPVKGYPFPLHLLAASRSRVALDTCLYQILGLTPDTAPVWAAALNKGIAGARPGEIRYPDAQPSDFDATGFEVPARLRSLIFIPGGRARRAVKRAWDGIRSMGGGSL